MNLLRFCCYQALFFVSIIHSVAFAQSVESDLTARLATFRTMKADFKQDVFAKNGKLVQKSRGKMVMARPNLFYWEITQPVQQTVMTNGKFIWVYDKDLAQATEKPRQADDTLTPADFISGDVNKMLRYFHVSRDGNKFRLKAINRGVTFREIQLIFNKNVLRAMRLVDQMRQTTDVYFSNISYNQPVNKSLFTFKLPDGVSMIRA